MSRIYNARFVCGENGCKEFADFEAKSRRDYDDLYRRNGEGKWKCLRHQRPTEVISRENPVIIRDLVNEVKSYGSFWNGGNGFTHGPGFQAYADDFPEGTILRVTAELILPDRGAR